MQVAYCPSVTGVVVVAGAVVDAFVVWDRPLLSYSPLGDHWYHWELFSPIGCHLHSSSPILGHHCILTVLTQGRTNGLSLIGSLSLCRRHWTQEQHWVQVAYCPSVTGVVVADAVVDAFVVWDRPLLSSSPLGDRWDRWELFSPIGRHLHSSSPTSLIL